ARGMQVLHASAVAGATGIVAFCGTSGAGKSTLAGALEQRGHELVADDALPFAFATDAAIAYPLSFALRLRPGGAALLGADTRRIVQPVVPPAPLRAIVLLEEGEGTVALADAGDAATVGELLPHLYCFALDEGKEALVADTFELVRSVPVLRLAYPHVAGS